MPSEYRSAIILLYDLIATILIWYFAFLLRYNFNLPSAEIFKILQSAIFVGFLNLCIGYFLRLHKASWRFFSMEYIQKLTISSVLILLLISSVSLMLQFGLPRTVLIIFPFLHIFILGGSRFIYRYYIEVKSFPKYKIPIVIYGAGASGMGTVKDIKRINKWAITAFLDDNKALHGKEFFGIPVIGDLSQLRNIKIKYGLQKLCIAMPSSTSCRRNQILQEAKSLGLTTHIIPSLEDLILGKISISEIKSFDLKNLLGRKQVNLSDVNLKKLIQSRVILVSGAGGSIGSELCRQILNFDPLLLICLDISEVALYKLEQEIIGLNFSKSRYLVADVKNKERLKEIFNQFKPEIVFHAAAYKHVPLLESYNASEALLNNVIGTYHLATVAKYFKVKKFIFISTDKAVNPSSVMGASKSIAEIICRGLQLKSKTDFLITRFGNVLGSSGSVVLKFREQIKNGGPLTVTHPEITRYFMSIPEAAQLVIQAALIGKGGQIFILDMGEPVKIVDLAKDLIKFSGFDENDIKIKFTGLRPGEKLYEELLNVNENILPSAHPKLKIATPEIISAKLVNKLIEWVFSTTAKNEIQIKKELDLWVKGFYKTSKKKNS